MPPWFCGVRIAAVTTVLLLSIGCATLPEEEQPSRTTLITARAGSEVTLQWQSEKDTLYTVVFADKLSGGATWQPVRGLESIAGTGGTLTFRDNVPEHVQRYYRLTVTRKP